GSEYGRLGRHLGRVPAQAEAVAVERLRQFVGLIALLDERMIRLVEQIIDRQGRTLIGQKATHAASRVQAPQTARRQAAGPSACSIASCSSSITSNAPVKLMAFIGRPLYSAWRRGIRHIQSRVTSR